ncbi:MAG TPA: response regulator [Vicinamibacterales bacterium]
MPHKLLLADDSVTIQRVIELTFADEDVQVIAVGNGAAAIERVQRDRPDIVLADVGMPERDGYEVAAFIKGTPSFAHIPVVLLTGAFEPVDEQRARAVGCDGVLVKPFEPQLVITRVKDLLAGRQPPGMWSGQPAAQGPIRQPSSGPAGDLRSAPAPTPHGDSLEAYFDHLDAAFGATPDTPGARAANAPIPISRMPAAPAGESPSRPNDPFADWDPDLQGDPTRPAGPQPPVAFPAPVVQPPPSAPPLHLVPSAAAPAPAPMPAPPVAAAGPAPIQIPSLAEAFTALLSAEQSLGLSPSIATIPPLPSVEQGAPAVTEQMVDDITARVLARLGTESRPAILDVAERLVREEIERIKSIG